MKEFDRNDFDPMGSEFDERTGEELYEAFLEKIDRPKDEFIYYYGGYRTVMTRLTSAAKDLLAWMAFNCEVNSGRVFIQSHTQKKALEELGITMATYYKALNQLKEANIIKGSNAAYYVNPAVAWKGAAGARSGFMKVYPRLKK